MASRTAACVGQDEVRGIGAYCEDHVACVITDLGVGVSGQVVQEHVAGGLGVLGRGGLIVGDFVQRDYDRGIAAS